VHVGSLVNHSAQAFSAHSVTFQPLTIKSGHLFQELISPIKAYMLGILIELLLWSLSLPVDKNLTNTVGKSAEKIRSSQHTLKIDQPNPAYVKL